MKTRNYQIDLMLPMQVNKEIVFNEALLKLDMFCNMAINGFLDQVDQEINAGQKYILLNGENKNKIHYRTDESKCAAILEPNEGMVVYILKEKAFFLFDGGSWQELAISMPRHVSSVDFDLYQSFVGIDTNFTAPDNAESLYLYLNNDCEIDLSPVVSSKLQLIIKQNHAQTYKITWKGNILWPEKNSHQITQIPNSIDIITFHKLAESDHFLAEISGVNYQY